jgi:hypothetical protein
MKTPREWLEILDGETVTPTAAQRIIAEIQREAIEAAMRAIAEVPDEFPKGNTVENIVCFVLEKAMQRVAALADKKEGA